MLRQVATKRPLPRKRERPSLSSRTADFLRADRIRVHFSGVKAVDGVDVALPRGDILGLIGPNGAGKTTFINALTGFQRVTDGRVFLGSEEVTSHPPHRLARMGVARTFQGVRLFPNLTALENVELGALGVGASRREAREKAARLLARSELSDVRNVPAGSLPFGHQRWLGVLRALATDPTFLLLDEPAAGLNERESDELTSMIVGIREEHGCGILVIEHDMRVIMGLCDRVHVLDHGKTICEGSPREVQANAAVIEAYLGTRRVSHSGDS